MALPSANFSNVLQASNFRSAAQPVGRLMTMKENWSHKWRWFKSTAAPFLPQTNSAVPIPARVTAGHLLQQPLTPPANK